MIYFRVKNNFKVTFNYIFIDGSDWGASPKKKKKTPAKKKPKKEAKVKSEPGDKKRKSTTKEKSPTKKRVKKTLE